MAVNSFVAIDGANGWFINAASTSSLILGILQEKISSTDGDYADARPTMVDMLSSRDVVEIDVTGTLTAAMVGQFLKLSSTTGLLADAATAASAQSPAAGLVLMCIGFISASKGLFIVNGLQAERPAA